MTERDIDDIHYLASKVADILIDAQGIYEDLVEKKTISAGQKANLIWAMDFLAEARDYLRLIK